MQGICGIVLEEDKAFLSFSRLKKDYLNIIGEKEVSLGVNKNFIKNLQAGAEAIEEAMVQFEEKNSFSVNKVYLEAPSGLLQEKQASETVVFSKKKKIKATDINFGKKYIENKFLEWDERCLHNIILNYRVDRVNFSQAPLGFFTKKIEFNFLLIYIKDSLYKDIADLFYNLERNFAGIIARKLSLFSQGFKKVAKNQIVVSVNNRNSHAVVIRGNEIGEKEFDFSVNRIVEDLSRQYTVRFALASELLERYGTFKLIPYFKEISIKKGDSYLNISTKALGNFLKKSFSQGLTYILEQLLAGIAEDKEDLSVSVLGPLSVKEGFYGYVKNLFPYKLAIPADRCKSSSFGCAKYGVFKPLEKIHNHRLSLAGKIRKIYHEYF